MNGEPLEILIDPTGGKLATQISPGTPYDDGRLGGLLVYQNRLIGTAYRYYGGKRNGKGQDRRRSYGESTRRNEGSSGYCNWCSPAGGSRSQNNRRDEERVHRLATLHRQL